MKIVIKIGTQAILATDGTILENTVSAVTEQIAKLQQIGHNIVLVSSGAVGSGRKVARELLGQEYDTFIEKKQLLASFGQHELMHVYAKMFKMRGMLTAQLLFTKQDFQTKKCYLSIANLLKEGLEHKNIVPVINESDSIAIEDSMFTDNDELAGLIAAQLNVDKLIILTSIKGVYNGHPNNPNAKLITVIDPQKECWPEVSDTKSTHGRGGMISKLKIAQLMSNLGITTHIVSIHEQNAIIKIINGEQLGTTILPSRQNATLRNEESSKRGSKIG
ncbi:Glutamate 5-kinase [Alphaproteobacteria bacterium]